MFNEKTKADADEFSGRLVGREMPAATDQHELRTEDLLVQRPGLGRQGRSVQAPDGNERGRRNLVYPPS